jgi:hypothetical protein
MKSVVSVLSVLLFVSLVPAQDKPPAPAGSPHDTIQQGKNAPDRERDMMAPDMMGPGCWAAQCADMGKENWPRGRPCFMHCPPPPFFFAHAFLLLLLVVNILLTIIVSLDMARSGRFNGLWIPVLLLAGIPGSAIYALFRIGDKIQCKQG